MAIVVWDNSLSIGVEDIDRQHAKLFDIINSMQEKLLKDRHRFAIVDALDSADNYISYHFATEERLMARANFPGLEAHKALHQQFVADMAVRGDKVLAAGDDMVEPAVELLGYFLSWLSMHILLEDQKLTPYLVEQGSTQ